MANQAEFSSTANAGFNNPTIKASLDKQSMDNVEKMKQDEEKKRVERKAELITQGMNPAQADKQLEQEKNTPAVSDVVDPLKPVSGPSFTDPNASQTQQNVDLKMPSVDQMNQGLDVQPIQQAMSQEAGAIGAGQGSMDATYNKRMAEIAAVEKEDQKQKDLQKAMEEEDLKIKKLQEEQAKIKPQARDFFATKSGFEKVMAGVGLFLASLTPQGAATAQKIISDTIDRDLENQKSTYNTKGEEITQAKGNYKNYMDMYKDDKVAKSLAKKDILDKLKMDLDMQAQRTSSQVAKAQIAQGIQKLELESQKLGMEAGEKIKEMKKKEMEGFVPGYIGQIKDPVEARNFKEMVADAPGVRRDIEKLRTINKGFLGGALSPSDRAAAKQAQNLLIGKLRVAITGPGPISEGERELIKDAIANPTSFFSLGSSNEVKLKQLLDSYNNKIDSTAKTLGLQREQVGRK